jgi:hypothetical protein
MRLPNDFTGEMQRLPLDLDTADRLLAGSVAPEDAPPGYADVALLLAALEPPAPAELTPDAELVTYLAESLRSSPTAKTRTSRRSILPRLKLASALATFALIGTTGLALAGSLPGSAQDTAATMLSKVGVSVPGPDSNAGTNGSVRGTSPDVAQGPSATGAKISELATSTELSGVAKGAAISTLASGGKSRAGAEHAAPVETPSDGGSGTADTASGGDSSVGTSEAATASDGHSVAGSGNAAAGQSHRP